MLKKSLWWLLLVLLLACPGVAWGSALSEESLAFLKDQGVDEAVTQELLATEQSPWSQPFEELVQGFRQDAQGLNEESLAFLRAHHVDEALITKMDGMVERGKVYPFNRRLALLKVWTAAYYFTDEQILESVQRLVEPLPRFTKLDDALLSAIKHERNNWNPTLANLPQATAKLADYPITINGQAIDNQYQQYPFLEYRDVTYFPLTEENNKFVGLKSFVRVDSWSGPTLLAFYVGRDERSSEQWLSERREATIGARSCTVTLLNQRMAGEKRFEAAINKIHGRLYADEMAYPLICYRDTLYLPLTWQIVVEELGWQYAFTEEGGLTIDSTDPIRPRYNDDMLLARFPDIPNTIDYVYLPDGFIGYRPSNVIYLDTLIVYKKAGQPIKQVNIYPQMKELLKGEYFMNKQCIGEQIVDAEMEPYVEGNILHILCATRQETFMLQINLETGEVQSAPYVVVGQ